MKERSRKYAKSRRLANDVEDEGNDDEEDDEEDGEADVRRVGKKHPKHVGQNVRRYPEDEQHGLRKKHLKVIRKRRHGDTDDEEEQGKPVKKKLLLKKKVGKIVDKERRKGKSPLKDKGMTKRGKNMRVFLRVLIPQHPISRGEYAKCYDVVVATQRANCDRKQPSVICRTDAFSKIIAGFDDSRRACVQKMGFGGLLELKISKLPRQLCYWLMTRLDGVNSYLVGGDGHVLPITPGHWEDVFGLRNSGLPVPEKDSDLPAGKALAYAVKYGEKNPANNKTTVLISNATRVLLGPLDKLGNLVSLANQRQRTEFMENFMIVLMGQILCPSTDGANMSTKLLGAVCVAKDADQYNWCEFCHKWLLDYAITCQRKLEVQGYAAGTGGCVLFLLVFYLDRLCRLPVRWDEFPRLKVWTEEEVEKVKLHDRKPTEDYGRLSTVDVVYREPHPLFGERRPLAEEVADLVFVPVVENEHWWCVAFALKDQKIWFIDSMYKNPAAEHSAELKKLIPAVDYVLLETDKEFNASPAWQTKQMGKWPLDVVGFPDYNDNHACGVVMLMAIRETANAFKKSMHVGEIGAARKALFLSHLNSDYNSCRPLIPEIIATHCR
ncbi:uncharacterized protein [Spinacia oleracea]|uniref:Uncharacterized protein isoform X1 n=1 Tax=Spinacia oleracea TaxID=3562 RepID=A0ABM3R5P5_SPIOL|nr:uncharacterized protein LOC110781630 isoform X1 [Spinacia oleracea]